MGIELTPAFWSGLFQIILVNIILSGDNALVIALACRNLDKRHQRPAIIIGSGGAIILRIIFGATLIMMLLNRFPIIVIAGGGLLGYIAGEVLATDPAYAERLAAMLPNAKMIFEIGGAVLVVVLGVILQRRARSRKHAEPVDLASNGHKE